MDYESWLGFAQIFSILPICITIYLLHSILSTTSEKEKTLLKNVLVFWYGMTFLIGTAIYFISFMNIPYIASLVIAWFVLMCCIG
jgi:hypothetical protein